jgi:hypothetical protein
MNVTAHRTTSERAPSEKTIAGVASAVLAEPHKLFDVEKVLFRTKELFLLDTGRLQLDCQPNPSLISSGWMTILRFD